jgi:hypothetical protein
MKTHAHKFILLVGILALSFALGTPAFAADTDGDGIDDAIDNCLGLANADQRDTDGDGSGNRCDGDLNNDFEVNSLDLGLFKKKVGTADPDADFNGDGSVNSADAAILQQLFLKPPGLAATAPLMAAQASVQVLEATIQQIEDSKTLTLEKSNIIDRKLFAVAANMKGASDSAFGKAKKASQSPGGTGDVEDLNTVETVLADIRPRLEQTMVEMGVIEAKLLAGEYTFDRAYIEDMKLAECQDLLAQMVPEARDALILTFPDLFPLTQLFEPSTGTAKLAQLPFAPVMSLPENGFIDKIGNRIMDFFIPRAEAVAALTCYFACKDNVFSTTCITCILKQGQNVINAWNSFKSCWNNAKKPFQAFKRAVCVAQFLVVVA